MTLKPYVPHGTESIKVKVRFTMKSYQAKHVKNSEMRLNIW